MNKMITRIIWLFAVTFFNFYGLKAQDQLEVEKTNLLNVGLGFGNTAVYDESFSLVRQNGLGPTLFTSFYHVKEKSSHRFDNFISLYTFQSEVSNPNFGLSGEHLHERFRYAYLRHKTVQNFMLSAGPSFVFDFAQIKPEGLVINNAPLFDFNFQLQIVAKVDYQFNLFNRKSILSYQLDLPFVGYNSRPDYLGFTEFSGKSKYFNKNADFSVLTGNYFYFNQHLKIAINPANKNSFSVNYNWYYANNGLSNLYQNMTNTLFVSYVRILSSK